MPAIHLSEMLTVLRQVLQEHPGGMHLDAAMVAAFIAGLTDMERAALALEQSDIERRELLAVAQDLDVVAYAKAGEIGGVRFPRPSGLAALADAIGASNVVTFPIVPRLRPVQIDCQGDGGVA